MGRHSRQRDRVRGRGLNARSVVISRLTNKKSGRRKDINLVLAKHPVPGNQRYRDLCRSFF